MAKLSNNVVIGLMLIMAAGLASAENVALVNGFIYDQTNASVSGATVTALCLNNSNSFTNTSESNGYYAGQFDCPMNGTVQVTATKNNVTGTATGTVNYLKTLDLGQAQVDVGLALVDVQIPEFPTAAAPVLLSMLSFGLLRLRKR